MTNQAQIWANPGDLIVVLKNHWGYWQSPGVGARNEIQRDEIFLCISVITLDEPSGVETNKDFVEQWAYAIGKEKFGWILVSGVLNDRSRVSDVREVEGRIL